jgi:hypothetical protein
MGGLLPLEGAPLMKMYLGNGTSNLKPEYLLTATDCRLQLIKKESLQDSQDFDLLVSSFDFKAF